MWIRSANCLLTWNQHQHWNRFCLAANIISVASFYKLTDLSLVTQRGFLLKKQNHPPFSLQTAPLTLTETWTSSCSTAVLLHARRLVLRVPSLTHRTWVFIYILFLFLCLGNMNSLFSVTDCSDSVPTELKTNTVYCRVWTSETWLLDTIWREIKIFEGRIRANY